MEKKKFKLKFNLIELVKSKLQISLTAITVIPLLVLGIVLSVVGIEATKTTAEDEVTAMLMGICKQLRQEFYEKYPGSFSVDGEHFYSDGNDIAECFYLLDSYKTHFQTEVTIFFGDTRAVTTIKDSSGNYMVGTHQSDKRITDVIRAGKNFASDDVVINGIRYYGVYIPLYDHGAVGGMVFAGVSTKNMADRTKGYTVLIIILSLILLSATILATSMYSRKISVQLSKIKSYLGLLVEKQTPDVSMAAQVLKREDEIGDLAKYAVEAGNQLKTIIGRDTLTGLYNRRTGRQFLELLWDTARVNFTSLAIVMSDIDFFKKVNDTYGHDVGDIVLKKVGEIMNKYCEATSDSFAIRWGGEEFLMGFLLSGPQTIKIVNKIRDEIKAEVFTTDKGENFKITMTFGVVTASASEEISSVVSRADAKLYEGKETGRDKIVN